MNGKISHKAIKISCRHLVTAAYLYMTVPIVIFFVGWLKPYLAFIFSAILLFGLFYFIKHRYWQNECFVIEQRAVIIILLTVAVWVFLSGIGGYLYQRSDWHARNAILRDLIDYSWPTVYPETGNALVYYYIFWMVPACVGKMFGWAAANFTLYLWTILGIAISMLLLCRFLKFSGLKKVLLLLFVYITWSGLNILGAYAVSVSTSAGFGLMGGWYGWADSIAGWQYTPNNGLIEWVFNQTIVPWVAVSLFLQDRRIDNLAYLGLCVLPFAPLPFVGIFAIFVLWAVPLIYKHVKGSRYKELLSQVFSIPNMAAIFSVFVVFLLFFSCNSATNENQGIGGIGWYIAPEQFTLKQFVFLLLFYIIQFLVYSILVFNDNRNNWLFYIINIWLFICPFIRVGTGRDFCMRASIPALFILMVLVIQSLSIEANRKLNTRSILLIMALTISSLSTLADWCESADQIIENKRYPFVADDWVTFCDKNASDMQYACTNYLTEKPENYIFYRYLAKGKSGASFESDLAASIDYRGKYNFPLSGGYYTISPKNNPALSLSSDNALVFLNERADTVMLSAISGGTYMISFNQYQSALDVPGGVVDENGTISVWGVIMGIPGQKYILEEHDGYYMIRYEDYALTYDQTDNSIRLSNTTGSDEQLWSIEKVTQ